MRALDNENSTQMVVDGLRVYYSLIRPHMALNGKTSTENWNRKTTTEEMAKSDKASYTKLSALP